LDDVNRGLKIMAILNATVMYLVLQMGALVTNTGSGDGCGASWPLCKGTWMPDWNYEAIIEFSHRAVSGLAGLMTLTLAIWVWRATGSPLLRWLSAAGVCLVGLQGALGGMAVIWPQSKSVLALHFGISLLCFSAVLLIAVLLLSPSGAERGLASPVDPLFRRWVWHVALFVYVVVYLGAYVRHVRASLACLGWPLCNGQLVPSLYSLEGANFVHRVGAALVVLLVLRLAVLAQTHSRDRADLQRVAALALLLVLVQAASGAVIALGYFNLLTQMAHTAIITLFWGALSYLCLGVMPGYTYGHVHAAGQ
jgi:cytochrome c oxidase assembly protein subunit 15